jgi:hypothetical protein
VLIDSNFEKFKPLMLASQQPGQGLDAGIQARFRSKGSPADQTAMRQALRGWLSAPVDVLLPAVRVYRLNEGSAQRAGEFRSRAAELLTDWGDEAALPSIRALAADTSLSAGARASLAVSAARLENPCRSSFLVPDGRGGMRTCRSFSEVVRLRIIPGGGRATCAKDMDQAEQKRLWGLLVRSREGPHARWFEGDGALEIVFRDGLKVTIQTNEDMGFDYTDTGLPARWSRTLENRPLFKAVSECMPRRELPKLLGYGN